MPISIADLSRNQRTVTVPYVLDGATETVTVTYKPGAFSGAMAADIDAVQDKPFQLQQMFARVLAQMIVQWDVIDADGAPYPTTVEALLPIGIDFLSAIFTAVAQDLNTNPTNAGRSAATSSPAASSASSPDGTPSFALLGS